MIVHGVDKSKFQTFRHYSLTEGSLDEFLAARDGALVGASIARRKGWKAGQVIDLRGQLGLLLAVKGLFFSGNEEQDNTILAGLEYVQDQYAARGKANQVLVKLAPQARAEDVAATIDALPLPTRTSTQAETAYVSGMVEDLGDMITISRLVILVTLLVVFVSVANTVAMSVRDRTRQLGMMRTLGFSRMSIMGIVIGEAALVCATGGLIGAGFAWVALQLQDVTVQARTLNLAVSMPATVMIWGVVLAAAIGALGGLLPAWRASRMRIVDAIGSVD